MVQDTEQLVAEKAAQVSRNGADVVSFTKPRVGTFNKWKVSHFLTELASLR